MKNRILMAGAIASILGFSTFAQAVSVDMTQGVPGYWTTDGNWVWGSVPEGYQQSATSNQLTITALPELTVAQSKLSTPSNTFWLGGRGLTGDFSATVTAVVTGRGGGDGFFSADNESSETFAGLSFAAEGIGSSYGLFNGPKVGLPWQPYGGAPLTLNLARTGDNLNLSYAVGGGSFTKALTLTGQNVLGSMRFGLGATGYTPNSPESTTISFSNFSYSSAPAAISGMSGGSPSNPTDLSAASVGSIYGTVGDPGHESDYYTFYWDGGDFIADVGVPGATSLTYTPDGLRFKLCSGGNCVSQDSFIASVLADEENDWNATLQRKKLGAGFYTIGVVDAELVPQDPPFYVTFSRPTTGTNEKIPSDVPEPATALLLGVSLAALASLRGRAGGVSRINFA